MIKQKVGIVGLGAYGNNQAIPSILLIIQH